MLDLSLFRHRPFVASIVAASTNGLGIIALMSFTGTFLVGGLGLTSLQAGGLLSLWSATSALSAVLVRPLVHRVSGTTHLVVGLVGTALGIGLPSELGAHPTILRFVPGLLVAGVASGLLNGGPGRQAIATVAPERAGLGTGANNTARYVGAAVGVSIVSILAAGPHTALGEQVAGWSRVAPLTGILTVLGLAVTLVLSRRPRRSA